MSFEKDVSRNMAVGTAVAGAAATGLIMVLAQLPQEKRIRVVKFLGLLFLFFIAGICLLGSFGVLAELNTHKIPDADKGFAMAVIGVMALPMVGVLYGFKRFFSK